MLAISMKIAYLKFHSNLPGVKLLTHWGWVTHICISKITIISSDNGLSPDRCQAIISSIAGILLVWLMVTNFSEVLTEIYLFSLKKMHLKMLSVKSRPFCLGLNVLISAWICPIKCGMKLLESSIPILQQSCTIEVWEWINLSLPGQNGPHFTDDIFRCIFVNEKFCILIKISLKFVPKSQIGNNPALVYIMAWRRIGDKLLSESMLTRFIDAYMWH